MRKGLGVAVCRQPSAEASTLDKRVMAEIEEKRAEVHKRTRENSEVGGVQTSLRRTCTCRPNLRIRRAKRVVSQTQEIERSEE